MLINRIYLRSKFLFLIYYYYNANFKLDERHIRSRGTFGLGFGGSSVLFRLAERTRACSIIDGARSLVAYSNWFSIHHFLTQDVGGCGT